ncbi:MULTISPECIES: cytochrome P450 [Mycobacterium]|uniref:Cytochrome P450 n=1 Tax=Mycobacterium intracellulare subsp. chimaera TaxID=222805 RepID=A0A220Y4Q8_MYCIT|nr:MULTISPECIES: cytochrome P450 [Mycobacterium]AGP61626.1 cytochrome P450 [Mycobacterium intracellulare subsp. yongonense 05-1390]AOS90297.1 cytochrome [Mycobacterium intracellulare subsp. chimaera]ARR75754.1 Cytochrome P450 [Mycobacterium intracellulare subsp. yongonense]ARR80911.1 cytochrome P450 [Mycobacterium intracellulare subsp. yongonense]ARV79974.1 cytochrome P450 [Mycobacterium intracellulare subsp. chimaera]
MSALNERAHVEDVPRYHFDRHHPQYREKFLDITHEMQQKCPMAWTETYDGHWVAAGSAEVFELARCPHVSNDHDINNERRGYKGISIPTMIGAENFRGGMLEMDDPEHRYYRTALNPYLSPAAVKRWEPFVGEIVRACLDERIETGQIDFVDDLANVVPAVLTLAMLGVRLDKWTIYNEPAHALVYTPPDSPDAERVRELYMAMGMDLFANLVEIRENPRPGVIDALAKLRIDGEAPPDIELVGMLNLLIGGGFDTTTALTAHALEWLAQNPNERTRLSEQRDTLLNPATEEFLRYFTPAPGDARTISEDMNLNGTALKEGDRLWLSWAMANRDPAVFSEPDRVVMDRKGNRHFSFGLGVHRCIGSNVARTVFKAMLTAVLDRMPDYECVAEGTVHYDSIGVIQGMRHLPATFTPGPRLGPGLAETLDALQRACDEQGLARPITERKESADI